MSPAFSVSQLLRRLRFRQLEVLVFLGEHRNLHRAAEAAHIAQPTATKMVRELEHLFGFALFERLPRGMRPTELGTDVLAFAQRALLELHDLAEGVNNKLTDSYEQLTVGTIGGATSNLVARAVAKLKAQRPHLDVRLIGQTGDETVNFLLEGRIDLAVGNFGRSGRHDAIAYEALRSEELRIVARRDHAVAQNDSLDLRSLEAYSWILPPKATPARRTIEKEFARVGMKMPANVVDCACPLGLLQLLRETDAVTVLPESEANDDLLADVLKSVPFKPHGNSSAYSHSAANASTFGILSSRERPLSAPAQEFIQCVRHLAALIQNKRSKPTTHRHLPTVSHTAAHDP
jgi:DNA-binding transcriptional LysR family regulator